MDHQSPRVDVAINVDYFNRPWTLRTSTVALNVEKIVNEYVARPNGQQTLISSYPNSPRQSFKFYITHSTTSSQILQILRNQCKLDPQVSVTLTSQIFSKAIDVDLDRNAITMKVFVTLSYATFLETFSDTDGEASDEEDEGYLVEKFVQNCVIRKEWELENDLCSICLENLSEVSEKGPTRMPCSHLFHDKCISQWLCDNNSCPLCRQVLLG